MSFPRPNCPVSFIAMYTVIRVNCVLVIGYKQAHLSQFLRNTHISSPETQNVTMARPLSKCCKQKNAPMHWN